MGIKRNKTWTIVALILAVITIGTVVYSSRGELSISELRATLKGASPYWLVIAAALMLGILVFEGASLILLLRSTGYPRRLRKGILYAAADVYFSAITPSASGGQPASAFFMIKDGVPGAIVTVVLMLHLVIYMVALLSIAAVCVILRPQCFLHFGLISKLLIITGIILLLSFCTFFMLLLLKQSVLFKASHKVIDYLVRHHIIRKPEKVYAKLAVYEEQYASCVQLLQGRQKTIFGCFLCNIALRMCRILVTLSVYLAIGGTADKLLDLFSVQCFTMLGSNCLPVPGGMGVADYMMLDGYGQLFSRSFSYTLEFLGRGLSFYLCILFSAVLVVAGYIRLSRRNSKPARKAEEGTAVPSAGEQGIQKTQP